MLTMADVIVDQQLSLKQAPQVLKANPPVGIGLLEWSPNGQYVVARSDAMPNVAWIWDVAKLQLTATLVQMDKIINVAWDVANLRLALCTGSSRVYMWSQEGCSCIEVPLGMY